MKLSEQIYDNLRRHRDACRTGDLKAMNETNKRSGELFNASFEILMKAGISPYTGDSAWRAATLESLGH